VQTTRRVAATDHSNWLIALRAPGFGGTRLIELTEHFGGVERLVGASRRDLRGAGLDEAAVAALKSPDQALLRTDLAWLDQPSHHLVAWGSERFPPLLKDIPSPPAALFVAGEPDVLWQPQVAVIGSRNPTAGGKDNARDFAGELARQGLTVTSGLATGIDSIAHAAALDADGTTVAVMGTGLDQVYPASGAALAERIRRHGALVSEFPPGTPAKREHFPARNRLISGLSLGVLVIEAGLRSGTLITARLAGTQGREVFALPGSIHNPLAKGCHRLIRDGAKLVESVAEVIQDLAPLAGQLADRLRGELAAAKQAQVQPAGGAGSPGTAARANPARAAGTPGRGTLELDPIGPQLEQDPEYRKLWSCLGYDPKPVDAIVEQSGLTARAVSAMLLMLELRGMVEAHRGGAYSRKKRGH
jgi:DNA processing protein